MTAERGAPDAAGPVLRSAAVGALTLVGWSAAQSFGRAAGPEAFGRPPWLAGVALLAAAAAALAAWRAADRQALARVLCLALVGCALFAGAAVPALPGLVLSLTGVALWTAAPWLRPGPLALAALMVLVGALPSALTTRFPGGSVTWLVAILPHLSLAVLVPSLLPGRHLRTALVVVAVGSGLVALAGLYGYLDLAAHLPFGPGPLLRTRLRLLGAHPNLGVPALVTAALAAVAVLTRAPGRRVPAPRADAVGASGLPPAVERTRGRTGPSSVQEPAGGHAAAQARGPGDAASSNTRGGRSWQRPVAIASGLALLGALATVGSRTGALLAVGTLGAWLVAGRLRLPWRRLLPALVALALLLPATGVADGSITRPSSSTVSKAVSFRSHMWQLGRTHLAAAPWSGHGAHTQFLQGLQATRGRYDVLPASDHPHNLLLWVGAAFGWTGLAALAWLLFASFASCDMADPRGRALTLAVCAAWLATAIDLGGATSTFVPALALLFASLLEAHGRAGEDAGPGPPHPLAARAWPLVGLALIAVGLPRAWGLHELQRSQTLLARAGAAGAPGPAEARHQAEALRRWSWTLPGDHRPALLRSQLLALDPTRGPGAPPRPGIETSLDALERALELAPDLTAPLHALALLRSQRDLDDPSVTRLLDRALELGAPGPEAARLQLDRALLAGHRGDAAAATQALLDAVLLDPGVVARCRTAPGSGDLLLGVDASRSVAVPVAELVAAMTRTAAEHADDPNYVQRVLLATPQVAAAAGDTALVEQTLATLDAHHHALALRQRARFARAAGDFDGALAALLEAGDSGSFQLLAETLDAAARAETLDVELCRRLWERVPQLLPDVLFELGGVATLLHGRLEWARRSGDQAKADAMARSLVWLDG